MIITREDLIQRRAAMKPNARGKRAFDAMLISVTCEHLKFEHELEQALMEGLARDPAFSATMGLF